MKKFLRFDCILLALTLAFCAACGGYYLRGSLGPGHYQVVTERTEAADTADDRVDLNTATEEELARLPGIGAKRAEAIAAYREANGGFQSSDELTEVEGIGEKTLEGLRDHITVS